jgi:hypothetical protein
MVENPLEEYKTSLEQIRHEVKIFLIESAS